jgi:hypothetical protein
LPSANADWNTLTLPLDASSERFRSLGESSSQIKGAEWSQCVGNPQASSSLIFYVCFIFCPILFRRRSRIVEEGLFESLGYSSNVKLLGTCDFTKKKRKEKKRKENINVF